MDADEIAIHEMQSNGVSMILNLLGKTIGQAGKPSHAHSHGEILTFHIAGGNVLRVRVPAHCFHVTADTAGEYRASFSSEAP